MRKALIALAVVAVLAAGAAGGSWWMAQREVAAGVERFRAALPPGSTISYASARPDIFGGSAKFDQMVVTTPHARYTAESVHVYPGANGSIRHLAMSGVTSTAGAARLSAADVTMDGFVPPAQPGLTGAAALKAIAIDHLAIDKLTLDDPGAGQATLESATLDDYGVGQSSRVTLTGLVDHPAHLPIDDVRMGKFTLAGEDLAGMLPPASPDAAVPQEATLRIRDIAVGAAGKTVATLRMLDSSVQAPNPPRSAFRVDLDGLNVQTGAPDASLFKRLGYDSVTGSVAIEGGLDRAARTLRVERLVAQGAGIGELRASMTLDNLAPALLDPHPNTPPARILAESLGLQLANLSVRYEDGGLATRVRDHEATLLGITPQQATAQAQEWVRTQAKAHGLSEEAVAPLIAFLAQPHAFAVTLQPPQPVAVIALPSLMKASPDRTLGLQVTDGSVGQ